MTDLFYKDAIGTRLFSSWKRINHSVSDIFYVTKVVWFAFGANVKYFFIYFTIFYISLGPWLKTSVYSILLFRELTSMKNYCMHVDWGTLGSSLSLQMGIPGYLSERGIGKECEGRKRDKLGSPAARQNSPVFGSDAFLCMLKSISRLRSISFSIFLPYVCNKA